MKLYISPPPSSYREDGRGSGGIWRVINAQGRWLPEYGVEIVDDLAAAEIVLVHGSMMIDSNLPWIAQNHGMYWTGDFEWSREFWQFNAPVIESLRRGHSVIVPSRWVAYPIMRDMLKTPFVIPHGVDFEDFEAQKDHDGFVLWAKPRVDVVSDPYCVGELARRAPDIEFRTTFGRPMANMQVIGAMPHVEFQKTLDRAMIWLATARETGDISSREAMARGIPVLGWDWGATSELVVHQRTGYLAQPNDYEDLENGLHYCIENRKRLGEAAREEIREHYQWKDLMQSYAEVLESTLAGASHSVQVSVVVPTYNYAHFLGECLDSIEQQTLRQKGVSIEIIVVDDASTDDTQGMLGQRQGLRVIRHSQNRGLCAALNTGHSASQGKYIINVDADNVLPPNALELLYNTLEEKSWIDVASGNLAIYAKDGNHRQATDWPFGKIDPMAHLNHINQLTSSSMMRASSIERLGGYRLRQRKNEDGEFWSRAISAGLRFEQVTQEPTLVYRWHDGNKSKAEGGEDDPQGPLSWNFYYPWHKHKALMPFASTVPAPRGSWAVRSYAQPHITVTIPCGPEHQRYLVDALDSVAGQTFRNIECVVANDTGEYLDVAAMGHPWVRVVDTAGRQGPAIARNTAIAVATAPLIVPLDADDMLYPDALLMYYQTWLEYPDSLVYADCNVEDAPGHHKLYHSGIWTWDRVKSDALYQDVILFAKQWWFAVGGYPTDQPDGMWEDWLFGLKLHIAGIGATYIKRPWGLYRHWTSGEDAHSKNDVDNAGYGTEEFKERLARIYQWIDWKEANMGCVGCGGRRQGRVAGTVKIAAQVQGEDVRIVYAGDRAGSFGVNSRVTPGHKYYVNRGNAFTVPAGDAWIIQLPGFEKISPELEQPGIPVSPPTPPPVKLDTPQGPPEISFAEILLAQTIEDVPMASASPVKEPSKDKSNGFAAFQHLKRVNVDDLRQAGFQSMEDVKTDILDTGGENLLKIRGLGPSTLDRMMEVILG